MPGVTMVVSDSRWVEIGLAGRALGSSLVWECLPAKLKVPVSDVSVHWSQYESESAVNATELVVKIEGDVDLNATDRRVAVNNVVGYLVMFWRQLPFDMEFGVWLLTPDGNAWATGMKRRGGTNFVPEEPHSLP